MENQLRNLLRFNTDDEGMHKVKDILVGKNGVFDYGNFIPMSEELDITFYTEDKLSLSCYLFKTQSVVDHLLNDLKNELGGVEPAEAVERILKKNNKVNLDKGKLIYKNIKKFGFPNKLQWAIENWGTKYNAIEPYFEGNRLYFESVSTTPIQIIKMVSEELKDMIIQHIWIDEMFGKECGFDEYCNGEKIFSIKPDVCSVEAYKLYIECYGSDSCIRIDDNGGYYKIMCDKCSGCGIY
jgi:hypothetical protein